MLCCIRAFCQRPLTREVIDDLRRCLAADERREFVCSGRGNFLDRTELAQQSSLTLVSHTGYCRQLRSEIAQLAPLTMIGDGIAMRLVANHLDQAKNLRVPIEIDR